MGVAQNRDGWMLGSSSIIVWRIAVNDDDCDIKMNVYLFECHASLRLKILHLEYFLKLP